ncbi:MAG: glycerate kinase [Ignavibacteriaceae bacterium]|jgi:glycerate kinase
MKKIKLLIAPNSFKECADAIEIAKIITENFAEPEFQVKSIPISDGGDGFLNICQNNFHLEIVPREIRSFYDDTFSQVPVGVSIDHKIIYMESAEIIGMKKIPLEKRNPSILNSSNLGELLIKLEKEFLEFSKIILGLGGTATNDLGLGLCVPFGLKLFNKNGEELQVQPKYFVEVHSIVLPKQKNIFTLEIVTDVEVPLLGETGTSKTFAKQKGATEQEIEILEKGVKNIISILKKEHGIDFSSRPFGAGGGLLLGLSLVANLQVCFAEEFLLKKLHLEKELVKADFIITGEGSFDEQSLLKKGTGILINSAKKLQKKVFVICGKVDQTISGRIDERVIPFSLEKYFSTEEESIKNFKTGIEKACGEIKSYILSHP